MPPTLRCHLRRHVFLRAGKPLHMFSLPRPFSTHWHASETSRSEKLHNNSGARVRSLQDRTNNQAFGGPRKTNQHTLLTWKSAMRASDSASLGLPQSGWGAQGELCHSENVSSHLKTKRSAAFKSAGSINSKPKTRFRSVFCCLVRTSGGAGEREEEAKLSVFSSKRTHTRWSSGNWSEETFSIMEHEQRGRLMFLTCFLRLGAKE